MSDDTFPLFPETASFEAVQDALMERELGDGLPLVPPTRARVERMLAGTPGPDAGLGHLPPLFGEATPRAVAYCAVLAGCRPEQLPVLLAAVRAAQAPELNLLGLSTTTGSAALALLVHGAVASQIGMNAGINCLGPGNRANATLGRALALVLRNIGGARAETGDMATVGQPGKYTFCFAEGDGGPFGPLHARRGHEPETGAVTLLGVGGSFEMLPLDDRDTPEAILEAVALSMSAGLVASGAWKQPEMPEQVFILPPELAGQIADAGWDLPRVQRHLFEIASARGKRVAPSPGDIHPIVTGGAGVKMCYLPLWGGGSRTVTVAV